MARVEIDPSWQEQVLAAWEEFGDSRLGPDIADDARRYCPVDTGALKASIEHHMEGEDIIVSATGGGEDDDQNLYVFRRPGRLSETAAARTHPNPGRNVGSLTTREVHHVSPESAETGHAYARWVEMGHRVFHPSTRITGPETVSPRPFLRPGTLYRTQRVEGIRKRFQAHGAVFMTTPLPLAVTDELACVAWISSVPGFSAAMVGTVLPPDVNPNGTAAEWLQTGFVTVAVVGGNPDPLLPIRRTVFDVQCWASVPGSNRPPWMQSFALASAITKATWSTTTINRTLTPVVNGVAYPSATVQGAKVLTSFRRMYSDVADFACTQGDLWLSWIAPGDVIA